MNTVKKVTELASAFYQAEGMSIPQAAKKAAHQKGFGNPLLTLRVLTIVNDAESYGVTDRDTLVGAIAKVLGTHGAEKKNSSQKQKNKMGWISSSSRKRVRVSPVAAKTFRMQEQLQLL
jgi:hypothetical protein